MTWVKPEIGFSDAAAKIFELREMADTVDQIDNALQFVEKDQTSDINKFIKGVLTEAKDKIIYLRNIRLELAKDNENLAFDLVRRESKQIDADMYNTRRVRDMEERLERAETKLRKMRQAQRPAAKKSSKAAAKPKPKVKPKVKRK